VYVDSGSLYQVDIGVVIVQRRASVFIINSLLFYY